MQKTQTWHGEIVQRKRLRQSPSRNVMTGNPSIHQVFRPTMAQRAVWELVYSSLKAWGTSSSLRQNRIEDVCSQCCAHNPSLSKNMEISLQQFADKPTGFRVNRSKFMHHTETVEDPLAFVIKTSGNYTRPAVDNNTRRTDDNTWVANVGETRTRNKSLVIPKFCHRSRRMNSSWPQAAFSMTSSPKNLREKFCSTAVTRANELFPPNPVGTQGLEAIVT